MDEAIKKRIDMLSRYDMAKLWRFAATGHSLLSEEAGDYFQMRFTSLGGFSPEISKSLGWDHPPIKD